MNDLLFQTEVWKNFNFLSGSVPYVELKINDSVGDW